VAACKSQTAYINAQFGLIEKSLMDYDECIGIWRQNGNRAGLAGALMSMGGFKTNLNRLSEAKEHLVESLSIRKTLKEVNGWTGSANYLADVYIKEGNMEEAIRLLDEALMFALSQTPLFAPGICRLRTNIAKVFISEKDYEKAELHLEKALELAINTKQQYQLHDIYFELSKLHKLSFNYDKALAFYEQYHESKQRVINLNAATKLKNLEILNKVEITEKEVEIHRLKNIELKKRNKIIIEERKKSDNLLLNILPRNTAQELKKFGSTKTRSYDLATVLFSDFVNFTAVTETLLPEKLVERIHLYFSAFDEIVTRNKIEKIKTIGDAYMATGGIPVANTSNPVQVATAAIEMMEYVKSQNDPLFQVRIGIHTGPVVAGVVGNKKFAYDIWGDTVNIASRMESSGTPGKINISGVTYELIKDSFICHYRGKIEAKGKGMIDMYYIESQR
ncbi:MAG: adenylate/guanylate cyclase domain-containing protein, partial [Cyclobacteriaceae bacterium]